ncbi:hypothetical protein A3H53_03125 [Candidatus Nomurabacteria bacterium RIFCSPLOWO2_02_FULL_40_10]|uniref:BIG2 domain-containing protein n=2 Tax=Candidatus Nomuraibacteriota TaxID=1752729 RepID=A0A1F6XVH6_9BACT|nr:MAG: hypothetical protein A2642_02130 [Candidatus Nomurabacteria bacterium RIFCSPHIGHO2_01_FULL_39_10]OGI98131.1 MAG: hypothetical protein A3H53_03125 [Candidatus Nomurabacteria bacterium RIFCSPLOWO2_02_FULL_40_10]
MKLKFLLLSFFVICVAISAQKIYAASESSISADTMPPYPEPYESTNVTLKSYTYNLDSVLISWSENGKVIASGTGKKSFSATAPAAGESAEVTATIYLPDGAIERKIIIRPSVMELLWQANDSHIPPFYKGKALPTADSEVKVVAMPEIRTSGGLADPNNMTYAWKKDYTNNVDGSGYGKNFFLYINDYLEDSNTISVTASTVGEQHSSQASIEIGTAEPKILFYKNDSILGTIWEMALNSAHKIQGPEIVRAVPYFISPEEIRTPSLIWNWFINDNPVYLTSLRKNFMPLQAEEGKHGTSKLRLNIENQDKIFQTTDKEINIEF